MTDKNILFTDEGITKTFTCARPLVGQHVFLQLVGVEGSLSLCEVEVFTTEGKAIVKYYIQKYFKFNYKIVYYYDTMYLLLKERLYSSSGLVKDLDVIHTGSCGNGSRYCG